MKNYILAITACLLWSSAFAFVKKGLIYLDPLFLAGIRFMIAGMILLPLALRSGNFLKNLYKNIKIILFISFVQTFLSYSLYFTGMLNVRGAQAAIVIGSAPVIVGIFSHLIMRDDKFTLKKVISSAVAFTGIIVIGLSTKPWSATGRMELFGIFLLLGGISASAMGNILIASKGKKMNPLFLSSTQLFLGGLMLTIVSFLFETSKFSNISRGDIQVIIPVIFYLSMISAACFGIWFYLLQRIKVSELNFWKFLIPVFGALFSWILIKGEEPELATIAGMILVGLSIFVLYYKSFKRKKDRDAGS